MDRQLVIFRLGTEYFGVDIDTVESIVKLQPVTIIPHTPDFMDGVTNLRGAILPVIDLHKRFGMNDESTKTKESRIIVVAVESHRVGLVVDAVSEVLHIPEDAIEPPPSMISSVDSSFITGIAKLDDRLVILLDMPQVLSFQEQSDLARALK